MTAGAASVVAVLATAGIEAAKVAVLAVLGLMVAAAAGYFGVLKVAQLLGFSVPTSAAGLAGPSIAQSEYAEAQREWRHDMHNDDSWGEGWSNASGTGSADVDRWRY